jgi:hypothetical protein
MLRTPFKLVKMMAHFSIDSIITNQHVDVAADMTPLPSNTHIYRTSKASDTKLNRPANYSQRQTNQHIIYLYIYMYMTHMTIVILYYIIIIWSQMISYIHTYNMYHRPPSGTSPWPWRTWEDPTYHNHLPSQIEQRCAKFHELSIDSVVGCWFQSILTRYR